MALVSIKKFAKHLVSVSMVIVFATVFAYGASAKEEAAKKAAEAAAAEAAAAEAAAAEEAAEAAAAEAAAAEAAAAEAAFNPYAEFLDQAPFRDGVFKNPAYEEVNAIFPLDDKALMMGFNAKVRGNFWFFRKLYMDAEGRLADKSTEDADLDMFQMAYAYEMLSCIGDLYVSKGKVKAASDETIDNGVLKGIVSEKVQEAPAELWKFLLFSNATYLPKDNTIKNRVAFATKNLATGTPLPAVTARWGFVKKVFNGYRNGEYKDKKVK